MVVLLLKDRRHREDYYFIINFVINFQPVMIIVRLVKVHHQDLKDCLLKEGVEQLS